MKQLFNKFMFVVLLISCAPLVATEKEELVEKKEEIKSPKPGKDELEKRAEEFKKFKAGIEETEKYNYVNRGLLVLLDDSEARIEYVSIELLTALAENAGPIIVSGSLVANVLSRYKEEENKDDPQALMDKYLKGISSDGKEHDLFESTENKDILLKASGFDPKKWIIKEINPSLYLFLPNNYLEKLNININDVVASGLLDKKKEPSAIELQLGLKVNHMKTVTLQEIVEKKLKKSYIDKFVNFFKGYFRPYADYFVDALADIFCTRSDYKNKSSALPVWSIYMTGHGYMNILIVSLALNDFKKVLSFLEYNINTRLFVYSSCYAAGSSHEVIYKEVKAAIQKSYSFTIITQALTDSAVENVTPLLNVENSQLVMKPYIDFDGFLSEVTQVKSIDYKKASDCLFLTTDDYLPSYSGHQPQIKLPGTEWFSVIDDKSVVSIGSIFAKTWDRQKTLDIQKFFKKNEAKKILLYAKDIPFELAINDREVEDVFSMLPGNAIHTLKKVSSSSRDADNLLDLFMSNDAIASQKIFLIAEIKGQDKSIKNVIIFANCDKRYAIFSDGDKTFIKRAGKVAEIDQLRYRFFRWWQNLFFEGRQNLIERFFGVAPNIERKTDSLLPVQATPEDIKKVEDYIVKKRIEKGPK